VKEPIILAIDTSCDETSAAVTNGRRVLSNVISSQVDLHKKYGGVYPALAKRAHEERIDLVIKEALKRSSTILSHPLSSSGLRQNERGLKPAKTIEAIAVTYGPGLAIALEVGIRKAKELAMGCGWDVGSRPALREVEVSRSESEKCIKKNQNSSPLPTSDPQLTSHPRIPLIAINHLEGHIYSCLAENSSLPSLSTPDSQSTTHPRLQFPALCLIVSGGHTELVLMEDHGKYKVLGQTLDDACGEALDKAAKILKLGYPGGPIIEKLAEDFLRLTSHSHPKYQFSPPLPQKSNLNFSYSGLKTQLLYLVQKMSEDELGKNLHCLAASFQEACFEQLIRKTSQAIKVYQPKTLLCGGGVIANKTLRKLLRRLARQNNLPILFPANKNLITDNAGMIGVAAYFHWLRKDFVKNPESLDREPRLQV